VIVDLLSDNVSQIDLQTTEMGEIRYLFTNNDSSRDFVVALSTSSSINFSIA
jgi:hypothetical protein